MAGQVLSPRHWLAGALAFTRKVIPSDFRFGENCIEGRVA